MKKAILLSVSGLLVGVALSVTILANPFDWNWVGLIQKQLPLHLERATPEAQTEGQQLWTCGMHPHVIRDEPGTCPICQMTLTPVKASTLESGPGSESKDEQKILYWQAPMDPTYIRDEPGKSPMGMDLVPVYEDAEGEAPAGTVRIDPVFVQNMGVQSVEVERTDIPFTIRTVGSLTYNDRQITWITTKYEGWIEKVFVNFVGETVTAGQKLFEIYSPRLVTTQEEYLQAIRYSDRLSDSPYPDIRRRAESLVESGRKRLQYWDVSDEQIETLRETGQVKRTLSVFSPVSGLVVEKMNRSLDGMFVKPGMNLYQIVDLSTIWVEAEVFENQVPWLEVGRKAVVESPYQPGRRHRGTIRYIYPFFNNQTRTLKVSIELPNPDRKLRADMYVNVTFSVPSAAGVLAVPEDAVLHSGERNIVVIDLGGGSFRSQEVTLGVNGEGLWEVMKGLSEGDRVVVSAQFLIDSESNLKEAIRKMLASREAEPTQTAPTTEH